MKYRPIPKQFTKNQFHHSLVVREGDIAIYERARVGREEEAPHFEVVRIRRHEGYEIAGNVMPPSEVYPSNEKWGTDGFTCITRADADRKFQKLRALVDQPAR